MGVPSPPAIHKNGLVGFLIVHNVTPEARAGAVAGRTRLLEEHALTHNIGARLPLARIAEAHELVEQGRVTGNVVLEVGGGRDLRGDDIGDGLRLSDQLIHPLSGDSAVAPVVSVNAAGRARRLPVQGHAKSH